MFTEDEAQKLLSLLKTIDDDPYALAIRLDFNLFIRVGELTGLKWEDVDINKRTVYICHQVTYEPKLNDNLSFGSKIMTTEGYLKGCTSQGYRHEYLTDEAVEILKQAKELNPDGEYVFMPYGRPMITTTFNKRLKKYCTEAKIPYHSSHNTSLSQGHDTRRGLFGYICQFRNEELIKSSKTKVSSHFPRRFASVCTVKGKQKSPYPPKIRCLQR